MGEYKQVILIRMDLKLPKGKACVQASHASVEAALKADKEKLKEWRNEGQKKVVLKVDSEEEVHKYAQLAKDQGISTATITDAGKTCIAPGTVTCVGIGPDDEDKIEEITGNLKML
ncbi:peptidyl-tRNA hydrolase Pth2 [Nanoarchaeota archaeon]